MPRLGAVRRLPPSAGRSDARLPAGHRRNPTGAEQCPCAAEKTARVSWADPASTTKTPPALRTYCFTSNLHVVSSLWKWLGITQQDGSPYASWLGLPLQGLKPS
ncbi:uncharacterized protein LOC143273016 isoform X6 [Peromyscus maniculatus bairdii]|uniref:uncharacterized protein LOC143273016 isoform X6 n=1 Tax=Peromyscus maniculatus bairdii TaxID=230844 RepID=UPI003FD056C2